MAVTRGDDMDTSVTREFDVFTSSAVQHNLAVQCNTNGFTVSEKSLRKYLVLDRLSKGSLYPQVCKNVRLTLAWV